jgi:hypothetical protein
MTRRHRYHCRHADCDYYGQIIIQQINPGVFPSCKACGRTLETLQDETGAGSMTPEPESVYNAMIAAGVPTDSHESDLYVPVTPTSMAILNRLARPVNVTTFTSRIDGALWYDIPFAYTPWWDARWAK